MVLYCAALFLFDGWLRFMDSTTAGAEVLRPADLLRTRAEVGFLPLLPLLLAIPQTPHFKAF